MPREVAILVVDGVTDSGLSVTLDVLRAASAIVVRAGKPPPFRTLVASPRGGTVRVASGLTIGGTRPASRAAAADIVLVPGVWIEGPDELDGLLARADVALTMRAIERAHRRGALIGASCAGTFFVAQTGLLDRRRATTTWWLARESRRRHPAIDLVESQALVIDDRLITAGAVFAVADLALHLVARFAGPAVARQTARALLLDRHPSQAPYMALRYLKTDDAVVRRAEAWARAHLADGFDVATLARRAGASPRTLARRLDAALGLNPIGFVQRLRVETAIHLLETSRLSLDEISARVGYADANTLAAWCAATPGYRRATFAAAGERARLTLAARGAPDPHEVPAVTSRPLFGHRVTGRRASGGYPGCQASEFRPHAGGLDPDLARLRSARHVPLRTSSNQP